MGDGQETHHEDVTVAASGCTGKIRSSQRAIFWSISAAKRTAPVSEHGCRRPSRPLQLRRWSPTRQVGVKQVVGRFLAQGLTRLFGAPRPERAAQLIVAGLMILTVVGALPLAALLGPPINAGLDRIFG